MKQLYSALIKNNRQFAPLEKPVQTFFAAFLSKLCADLNTKSVFRDTSAHNAPNGNFKVDCLFVPRNSAAGSNCSTRVNYNEIVALCELKHSKSRDLTPAYSQLARRNFGLFHSQQRRSIIYSFISDGENVRFFQTASGDLIKSSGWLPLLSISDTNSKIECGAGYDILIGILFANYSELGYESVGCEIIPTTVHKQFGVLNESLYFCHKGKYSTVFSYNNKSVLKCCFDISQYNNEIRILREMSDKMILTLDQCMIFDNVGYILRSPCTSGTLLSSEFSKDAFCTLIIDVCNALNFLHSLNCIHGDVSPANILIHNDSFVLNDFGVSKSCLHGQIYDEFFGNHLYCANRWFQLLMFNEHVKASFTLDFENLFFVLLAFAGKITWQLPWENEIPRTVATHKFLFCGSSNYAFRYLSTYCHREAIRILHALYSQLWISSGVEVNGTSFMSATCTSATTTITITEGNYVLQKAF